MTTTDIVNHVKFSTVFAFIAYGFLFPKTTKFVTRYVWPSSRGRAA